MKSGRAAELTGRLGAPAPGTRPEAVRHYMLGLLHFAPAAGGRARRQSRSSRRPWRPAHLGGAPLPAGLVLLEGEQFARALPELPRALALEPNEDSYQLPLAKALARTGDSPGAPWPRMPQGHPGRPSPADVGSPGR